MKSDAGRISCEDTAGDVAGTGHNSQHHCTSSWSSLKWCSHHAKNAQFSRSPPPPAVPTRLPGNRGVCPRRRRPPRSGNGIQRRRDSLPRCSVQRAMGRHLVRRRRFLYSHSGAGRTGCCCTGESRVRDRWVAVEQRCLGGGCKTPLAGRRLSGCLGPSQHRLLVSVSLFAELAGKLAWMLAAFWLVGP